MSWEVVPPEEYPQMFAALKDHQCVTCYEPIEPYDGNLYCYTCDPREAMPLQMTRECPDCGGRMLRLPQLVGWFWECEDCRRDDDDA